MSDFKAKIIAELDTTQVEQKINELDGKKVKFGVDGGNAQKEVEKVDNSIKSATKSTKTFSDTLKTSAKLGAAYSITSQAFQAIREAASKAKEAIQEFDAAVMDLRMATGGTYTEVSNLVKEYNELGQAIGATTKEISSGADSWLRQGHSTADTNTLIKDSMILSKVAELESAEATQYLTSAMRGYKVEVEDVIGIVDKLTSVDLVSATNAGGLAEAMSKTAVSANTAGVSMDKLLGYLAATGEVTQESMSVIGNAFKTFFARYSAIKSGKLELIDDDGTVEVLSDVEQSLKNVGIDIRTTITDFDNAGDVLDNLAEKWDNLNSVQKSAIASAFGGTRQKERFLVLMENYSQATSYMETSMNSAGTAEQKFEAYLDSLEAKTKSLQASFESLAINTFSTEMFGGIINATSSIVTFLDKTNLLKGTLVGLTAAGAIKAFTMLATGIANASIRLNEFNSALKLVRAGNIGENEVQMLARMTANLSQSQLKAVVSSKALSTEQRIAILTAQGLSKSEAEAALSSMGLATAEGAAATATVSLSGAIKGLWATLMANPLILVATAIAGVVTVFSSMTQATENAKQEAEEHYNKLKETVQIAKEEGKQLDELISKYKELKRSEYQDSKTREEIKTIQNDIVDLVGQQALNLDLVNGKLDDEIVKLKDIRKIEAEQAVDTTVSSYHAAKDSMDRAIGEESFLFANGFSYVSNDWWNNEKVIIKVLQDNGFSDNIGTGGFFGSHTVISDYIDEGHNLLNGAIEKADLLSRMIEAIKKNYPDYASSDLYNGLVRQRDIYLGYVADTEKAARDLAESQIILATYDNELSQINVNSLENYTNYREKLINLVQNSPNLSEAIKAGSLAESDIITLIDTYLATIPEYSKYYDEVTKPERKNQTTISKTSFFEKMLSVEKLSKDLDMLNKVYTDVKDGKSFDFSSIFNNEDFGKVFGALPSYEKFIEIIANSPDDISKCQSAFNSLVGEYIGSSKVLDDLSDETRDATVAFLKQNGVANAAEVADRKLAVQKEKLALETGKLKDATREEIIEEFRVAEVGSVAQQALAELALAKIKLRDNPIDTSEEIKEIIELAEAARVSAVALSTLHKAERVLSEVKKGSAIGFRFLENGEYEKALEVGEQLKNGTFDFGTFDYSFIFDEGITGKNSNKAFDWIEIAINRVKENIDILKDKAANAFDSFANRATATKNTISEINKEIGLQNKAYDKYMSQANSVKLSDALKEKVRNGSIEIQEYDSSTSEKIKEYQDYYEKALAAKEATKDLQNEIASLYEESFNRIATEYDNILGQIEHKSSMLEIGMDKAEIDGFMASTKYYEAMALTERETLSKLKNERAELISALNTAIDSKQIEVYDEKWYDLQGQIDEVTESILESEKALSEYGNEMRQIAWDRFDSLLDTMTQINDESDFIIDLIGDNLYDDMGNLNEDGMAVIGLHGANYNAYMEQAIAYAKEIEKINKDIANNPADSELIDRKNELIELQRESILAAEDEKNAMVDMVSEGIDLQLEALQDLIDSYKDSLDSAKDLYDYQKKIANQTKTIASIEKQMAAYANDDSEETKAKVQQLKIDLEEAQSDLEETQYDKYIDDQKELLDSLYDSYEETLNSQLDNVNGLISDVISAINEFSGIDTTITDALSQVGITMSSAMETIWGAGGNKLKVYDENNTSAIEGIGLDLDGYFSAYYPNSQTGLQSALGGIVSNVNSLLEHASNNASSGNDYENNETVNNNKYSNSGSGSVGGGSTTSQQGTTTATSTNGFAIGSKINAGSAMIYDYAGDTSGEYQYFGKDPIYTVIDEKDGYVRVRHHSLSTGSSGWFKKSDVKAYKTGGLVDYTGLAQVDGTPSKPELMLNSADTENFLELRDLLRAMSMQELSIGDKATGDDYGIDISPRLTSISDISGELAKLKNNTVSQSHSITFGDTNINIDHVDDYNDFVTKLQHDGKFEDMILAMTAGRMLGGSSLGKYKNKWK